MRALSLLAALALAACGTAGTAGPAADVTDAASLETYLQGRNLQVVLLPGPAETDFDAGLQQALTASYAVTGTQPPGRPLDPLAARTIGPRPPGPATVDLYTFESAEDAEAGIDALKRSRLFGELYQRDGVVVAVRGGVPTLRLALTRAFGTPRGV
ncbi:hypothetical protein [Rubrivirga sp. IMCC45206]|uniref:hypothetical protein n=1 Tax=Rubrivirga sp. IMCC45206 TaxID=3391614 RepID=UPI00398FE5A2